MPKPPRMLVPGYPHHIRYRGNRKCDVFIDEEDRYVYFRLIESQIMIGAFSVWAYVFMTNHVHLIIVLTIPALFSKAMGTIHSRYAEYFNRKYGYSGHLWDLPYDSSVIADDQYLHNAIRYVEQNPVRAGMVPAAHQYRWSSAAFHCGMRRYDRILNLDCPLIKVVPDWKSWLASELPEGDQAMIKDRLNRGLPYADESSRRRLEKIIAARKG